MFKFIIFLLDFYNNFFSVKQNHLEFMQKNLLFNFNRYSNFEDLSSNYLQEIKYFVKSYDPYFYLLLRLLKEFLNLF